MLSTLRNLKWNTIGTVGAFIVALVALVRPDVEPLLLGKHLAVSLPKEFIFNHRLGVLWITPWVDIRNEGGRQTDIAEVSIFFRDSDGEIIKTIGDSYLTRTSGEPAYFPWTTLSVKPGAVWVDRINFRQPLPAKDEDEFRQLVAQLEKYWISNLSNYQSLSPQKRVDPARKSALQTRIKSFFDRHFRLQRGAYKILIVLKGKDGGVMARSAYELVLFDSAIADIQSRLEEYVERPSAFFDGSLLTSVPITPILDEKLIEGLQTEVQTKGLL